jgi:hypothetical protein
MRLTYFHHEEDRQVCNEEWSAIRSILPDGTGEVTHIEEEGFGGPSDPAWSPDGTKLSYHCLPQGSVCIHPSGEQIEQAVWADWQPLRPPGYARPKGATPLDIRLVPAFDECTGSSPEGMTHAGPLAVPSCHSNPMTQSSAYLTMPAPDRANPYATSAIGTGLVTLKVACLVPGTTTQVTGPGGVGECTDPGDQIDVKITTTTTGTVCVTTSGGCAVAASNYQGEIMGLMSIRITDRFNGAGQVHPGTAQDYPFKWTVQCVSGSCNSVTSADLGMPDVAREGKRAVWQLGKVQVYDGGADGDTDTTGDNTLFMEQGLFVP